MFICDNCKDSDICKLGRYKNLLSGYDHPISTDSVFEAFSMFSKTSGEGVKFTNIEYNNQPNKVIILYRIIADKIAKKRNEEIQNLKK